MVHRKQIPHYRLGKRHVRFSEEELDEYFANRHVPIASPVVQEGQGK